ncbi:MAG: hypothetical protein H0X35_04475, partial [Pseudonocardiales bacterium]|nr:hypothetical protein [Pseudonocardiales bacterium]
PGSSAVDVPALLAMWPAPREYGRRAALTGAVGDVLAALVALADPAVVVVGGPWGSDRGILAAIEASSRSLPRGVAIEAPIVRHEPSLTGARTEALEQLRVTVTKAVRTPDGEVGAASPVGGSRHDS